MESDLLRQTVADLCPQRIWEQLISHLFRD